MLWLRIEFCFPERAGKQFEQAWQQTWSTNRFLFSEIKSTDWSATRGILSSVSISAFSKSASKLNTWKGTCTNEHLQTKNKNTSVKGSFILRPLKQIPQMQTDWRGTVAWDVTSKYLWGRGRFCPAKMRSTISELIRVVHPVTSPAKIQCNAVFALRNGKLKDEVGWKASLFLAESYRMNCL